VDIAPQPCFVEELALEANQVSKLSLLPLLIHTTAFNWKQKLLLKEEVEASGSSKASEIFDYGNMENAPQLSQVLEGLEGVEVTDGFSSFEFTPPSTKDLPELDVAIIDQSKKTSKSKNKIRSPIYKIQYPALFGSHKTGFLIEREKDKNKKDKKKTAEVVRFGKNKGEIRAE
jgi:hypothetical protein